MWDFSPQLHFIITTTKIVTQLLEAFENVSVHNHKAVELYRIHTMQSIALQDPELPETSVNGTPLTAQSQMPLSATWDRRLPGANIIRLPKPRFSYDKDAPVYCALVETPLPHDDFAYNALAWKWDDRTIEDWKMMDVAFDSHREEADISPTLSAYLFIQPSPVACSSEPPSDTGYRDHPILCHDNRSNLHPDDRKYVSSATFCYWILLHNLKFMSEVCSYCDLIRIMAATLVQFTERQREENASSHQAPNISCISKGSKLIRGSRDVLWLC